MYIDWKLCNRTQDLKKHRLICPAIDKALMSIVDDKISCETYRENEAVRLMNIGDYLNFIF